MAISIPSDAILQPRDSLSMNESGNLTLSVSYKGPYKALQKAILSCTKGDKFSQGGITGTLESAQLSNAAGGYGILTINLNHVSEEDDDSNDSSKLLKDVWTLQGVRNDMSLFAYCGPSGVNARRAFLEAWQKEPDAELANQLKFKKSDDSEEELNEPEQKIAGKMQMGIDSVMRFYPLITRRRIYSKEPTAVLENLAEINTPPVPATSGYVNNVKVPTGLSSIIGKYSWLKCQDDADEQDDGTWIRTEAWMGSENAWDENLYGTDGNRWKMPLT